MRMVPRASGDERMEDYVGDAIFGARAALMMVLRKIEDHRRSLSCLACIDGRRP
jgi:hypothetical protein